MLPATAAAPLLVPELAGGEASARVLRASLREGGMRINACVWKSRVVAALAVVAIDGCALKSQEPADLGLCQQLPRMQRARALAPVPYSQGRAGRKNSPPNGPRRRVHRVTGAVV